MASNTPKGPKNGDSNNGASEEHPDIFATYEIVGDANGKALYRSEDGKGTYLNDVCTVCVCGGGVPNS